jgi:hypothetical protein
MEHPPDRSGSRPQSPVSRLIVISCSWLNGDAIIDGAVQPLLAAEVALRGLFGSVAQQEANLFEFTASLMAQPRAGAPLVPHAA